MVVEAFIDYEYKFVAKQSFVSKDHLTAFFGSITFYIGIFSLLFQMLVTNRILKRFGVAWAILMLPAGLLISIPCTRRASDPLGRGTSATGRWWIQLLDTQVGYGIALSAHSTSNEKCR